jgi:hypothetical protein
MKTFSYLDIKIERPLTHEEASKAFMGWVINSVEGMLAYLQYMYPMYEVPTHPQDAGVLLMKGDRLLEPLESVADATRVFVLMRNGEDFRIVQDDREAYTISVSPLFKGSPNRLLSAVRSNGKTSLKLDIGRYAI